MRPLGTLQTSLCRGSRAMSSRKQSSAHELSNLRWSLRRIQRHRSVQLPLPLPPPALPSDLPLRLPLRLRLPSLTCPRRLSLQQSNLPPPPKRNESEHTRSSSFLAFAFFLFARMSLCAPE